MDKNLIPKKKINVKKILEFVGITTIIMSVVGLGIYFFIKAIITPPDPPDPCGDDEIRCKVKGKPQCIPKNYCNYSSPEGQYYYDEDSCECTLSCNSSDEKAYTDDGYKSETTEMKHDKPVNELKCFKYCDLQDTDEAAGAGIYKNYCLSSHYNCGEVKNINGDIIYKGCLDKQSYVQCNPQYDIYCPPGNCSKDEHSKPYCTDMSCTDDYACSLGEDTEKSCGDSSYSCKEIYDGQTTKNPKLKNYGICSNIKDKYKGPYCGDKKLFGEKVNGDLFNGSNYCKNNQSNCEDNTIGISLAYPNCVLGSGLVEGEIPLTNKNLCDNGWLVDFQNSCVSYGEKYPYEVSRTELNCCAGKYKKTKSGGYTCCLNDTGSIAESDSCFLSTNFPLSNHYIDNSASLSETINCSESITESQMENFYRSIGLSEESFSEAENLKSDFSAGLYCKNNKYYAYCGKESVIMPGKTPKEIKGKYTTIDNNKTSTSGCILKNPLQLQTTSTKDTVNIGGSGPNKINVPICKPTELDHNKFWSRANGDLRSKYYSFYTIDFNEDYDSYSDNLKLAVCKRRAMDMENIFNTSLTYTADGHPQCSFKEGCNTEKIRLPKNDKGSVDEVSWQDLSKNLQDNTYYYKNMFNDVVIKGQKKPSPTYPNCLTNLDTYNFPRESLGIQDGGKFCNNEDYEGTDKGTGQYKCFPGCSSKASSIKYILEPDGRLL